MNDPYQILGIPRDASDEEIKQAYRRLARKYHPDLNPGDAAAAKKMQEINDAYDRIKNPQKSAHSSGSYGGSYTPPYGTAYGPRYTGSEETDPFLRDALRYLSLGQFQAALDILARSPGKNARWYYLSSLANYQLGNQVTALEHIRKAVSMDPANQEYLLTLERMENGGAAYRQHSADFSGFGRMPTCGKLCLCYALQFFCCRGQFFCC